MHRRIALYSGDAFVVVGVISIGIALATGLWDGTSGAVCSSSAQTPFPPVGLRGPRLVVYEQCHHRFVSPFLWFGSLIALVGIVVLSGERLTRGSLTR